MTATRRHSRPRIVEHPVKENPVKITLSTNTLNTIRRRNAKQQRARRADSDIREILDLVLSDCRPQRSLVHDIIKVGDMVFYRRTKGDTKVRRATIVRGGDDAANGIISKYKPLATALLGATVGETVTVRQPTLEFDINVVRICRPESVTGSRDMGAGCSAGNGAARRSAVPSLRSGPSGDPPFPAA